MAHALLHTALKKGWLHKSRSFTVIKRSLSQVPRARSLPRGLPTYEGPVHEKTSAEYRAGMIRFHKQHCVSS